MTADDRLETASAEAPATAAAAAEDQSKAKPRKKFDIHVYRDWCKGCGICAALCPKQALSRNEEGGPVVQDPDACIGCGWCELHCPDFAISVRPRPGTETPADETGK